MTDKEKDKKKAPQAPHADEAKGSVEEKRLKPRLIRRRVTPAAKPTEAEEAPKAAASQAAEATAKAGKAEVKGEPAEKASRKKGDRAKEEAAPAVEAEAPTPTEAVEVPIVPPVIEAPKGKFVEPETAKGKKPKLRAKKERPIELEIDEALAEAAPEPEIEPEGAAAPVVAPVAHAKQIKVFGKEPHGRKPAPTPQMFRTGKKRKSRHEQQQQRQQKGSGLQASRPLMKTEITVPKAAKRVIRIVEAISVAELSQRLGVKAGEIIKKLMGLGIMATVNQLIDFDSATLVASDFGYEVESAAPEETELMEGVREEGAETAKSVARPPVVTVMGHVDHGKTSLLDAIRKTNVVSGEAGGITQHIGAYHVHLEKGDITFLDTPGHEAFTAMRARGAKVTDIVVLVVAADDGVKPQTVEAINHAKAAGVPIIVAINKIDLPQADSARVRQELSIHGLLSEDWGGDTLFIEVSAKKQIKIKELLELILLQSEMLELKAPVETQGKGIVIEAKLDKGRGPVATVLVQSGTMRTGDAFVTGVNSGRIRAMVSDWGMRIESAGPSMPIEILGLSVVPSAGDDFLAVRDEATAKQVASIRVRKAFDRTERKTAKVSLIDLYDRISKGEVKELKLVIKADVQGSIEAVKDALLKLSTPAVTLIPIHTGVGGISEGDCMLAAASNAIVIGFNVRPEPKAQQFAESENVDIRLYDIIYNLIDDVRKAMEGLLAPIIKEKTLGRAEVRDVIRITKVGNVAGSYVQDGLIRRNALARLIRDGAVVYQGKVSSLKRFKDDVREVQAGYECGISLENFNDVKVGDVIEAYILEEEAAKL